LAGKRAFRRSEPFGVPIRGDKSRIVGNPEAIAATACRSHYFWIARHPTKEHSQNREALVPLSLPRDNESDCLWLTVSQRVPNVPLTSKHGGFCK
jgi:hypothetical protein